jgi:hypothetical protein
MTVCDSRNVPVRPSRPPAPSLFCSGTGHEIRVPAARAERRATLARRHGARQPARQPRRRLGRPLPAAALHPPAPGAQHRRIQRAPLHRRQGSQQPRGPRGGGALARRGRVVIENNDSNAQRSTTHDSPSGWMLVQTRGPSSCWPDRCTSVYPRPVFGVSSISTSVESSFSDPTARGAAGGAAAAAAAAWSGGWSPWGTALRAATPRATGEGSWKRRRPLAPARRVAPNRVQNYPVHPLEAGERPFGRSAGTALAAAAAGRRKWRRTA